MTPKTVYYHNRIGNGICFKCGGKLDREGAYCSKCLKVKSEEDKSTRERYINHHICPRCKRNEIYGDEKVCPECRARNTELKMQSVERRHEEYKAYRREWDKKTKAKRIELGLCVRCGKRKADKGFKTCGICRSKNAEREKNVGKKN